MANMHVLTRQGVEYRIALHIVIPVANNGAGVAYRTALINSGRGSTSALPDGDGTAGTIDSTEKAALGTGALYEVVDSVVVPSSLSGAALLAYIDAYYTARSDEILTGLQGLLTQFGRTR